MCELRAGSAGRAELEPQLVEYHHHQGGVRSPDCHPCKGSEGLQSRHHRVPLKPGAAPSVKPCVTRCRRKKKPWLFRLTPGMDSLTRNCHQGRAAVRQPC